MTTDRGAVETFGHQIADQVAHADPHVRGVDVSLVASTSVRLRDNDPSAAADEPSIRMIAAMAAAARAASAARPAPLLRDSVESTDYRELNRAKEEIDAAATRAGERVLLRTREQIVVRAGEGVRDDSVGAHLDQVFGSNGWARHAVIDYVDGTGLVAKGLPNALSLGALGEDVRRTPDLKAFTVLGPRSVVAQVEDWGDVRHTAQQLLGAMGKHPPLAGADLRVLTHSRDTGTTQDDWYAFLKQNVGDVVIPDPIAVEPPYFLTGMVSTGRPVDCMIGMMGLVELVYASLLFDLFRPEYEFRFRLVGSAGAKGSLIQGRAFELTDKDLLWARQANLSAEAVYSSDEFVRPHSALSASMFAITECPLLDLPAAEREHVHGLVLTRGATIFRLGITY